MSTQTRDPLDLLEEALDHLIEKAEPFAAIDVHGNALPVADEAYHELDEALERAMAVLELVHIRSAAK